jgi:hypothetical protein
MRLLARREIATVGGKFTGNCTCSIPPAQCGEAGTHPMSRQEVA